MLQLTCPVRRCGLPLTRQEHALVCPRDHSFDVARSGYYNLTQPQDRRSAHAGDSKAAVAARRRSLDRGAGDTLRDALVREIATLGLGAGDPMLDAGCGDGFFTASVASALGLDACGVDISIPAVDAAARRYPAHAWIVANADRRMPFASRAFRLVMSITAAKHPAEFHRVLVPDGALLLVVPAPDDQAELREAVLGSVVETRRVDRAREAFSAYFRVESQWSCRARLRFEPAALADLFAGAYRGLRASQRAALESLPSMDVTLSHDALLLRPLDAPVAQDAG